MVLGMLIDLMNRGFVPQGRTRPGQADMKSQISSECASGSSITPRLFAGAATRKTAADQFDEVQRLIVAFLARLAKMKKISHLPFIRWRRPGDHGALWRFDVQAHRLEALRGVTLWGTLLGCRLHKNGVAG
jgi:hypothetical protein